MQPRCNLYTFVCIIAGIFLFLGPLNYAGANDFEQLRKESANIKTIQAHFVQKKSMKILSRPLISEGRFYYVAPYSFRWEYFKPLRSIVIAYKNNTNAMLPEEKYWKTISVARRQ